MINHHPTNTLTNPMTQHHLLMSRSAWIITILTWCFLASPAWATTIISGRVILVADGDTITILANRQQTRVRLANIDTPERKQPWGKKAKQALAAMVAGKWVEVLDVDRYGRKVGLVLVGGIEANSTLVRDGMPGSIESTTVIRHFRRSKLRPVQLVAGCGRYQKPRAFPLGVGARCGDPLLYQQKHPRQRTSARPSSIADKWPVA